MTENEPFYSPPFENPFANAPNPFLNPIRVTAPISRNARLRQRFESPYNGYQMPDYSRPGGRNIPLEQRVRELKQWAGNDPDKLRQVAEKYDENGNVRPIRVDPAIAEERIRNEALRARTEELSRQVEAWDNKRNDTQLFGGLYH